MDPTQQANPDVLAMLQALQGNNPQAGMVPQQMPVPPGSELAGGANQQASLGNGMLGQQAQAAGMYAPLATPPPMTAPPAPIY